LKNKDKRNMGSIRKAIHLKLLFCFLRLRVNETNSQGQDGSRKMGDIAAAQNLYCLQRWMAGLKL
jgi:hypothetical protein